MEENYNFSDEAKQELHRALCYFKLILKDELFLDDLVNQIRLILSMPEAFQIRYRNVRIVQLENYNYSIHYSIYGENIYILRILSQYQDF